MIKRYKADVSDQSPTEELPVLAEIDVVELESPRRPLAEPAGDLTSTFDAEPPSTSSTGRFPLPTDLDAEPFPEPEPEDELGILRSTIIALEAVIDDKDAEIASLAERLNATRDAVARRDETVRELRTELAGAGPKPPTLEARLADAEARAAGYADQVAELTRQLSALEPGAEPSPTHEAAAPPRAVLVCLTSDVPREYRLTELATLIGRGSQCVIQIMTRFVSREHARISRDGAYLVIEDLGSRNGVYVNAARIDRETLRNGDLVTIGETQFRFDAGTNEPD